MISDLIIKGKLRLCQLAGIDTAEITVPFTNNAINKLHEESNSWQWSFRNFFGEINSNCPKNERIWLIKWDNWILPHIVQNTPITGDPTLYTGASK